MVSYGRLVSSLKLSRSFLLFTQFIAAKLVPLAYGINKLQIMCVVEDDKVSVDLLQEKIEELEDLVQSVDIAAFQKI